jgi:hypothetical protein
MFLVSTIDLLLSDRGGDLFVACVPGWAFALSLSLVLLLIHSFIHSLPRSVLIPLLSIRDSDSTPIPHFSLT